MDRLIDVLKGHITEIDGDTVYVDMEGRDGTRHFIELYKDRINKYKDRVFVGNWLNIIITEYRCKVNLARPRYWTQEELDKAKKWAEEFSKKVTWE